MPKIDPSEDTGVAGLDGITVTGDPPMKPVSKYSVIGTSHPMPGIPDKVTGKTQWSGDVRLPGMLHARMVRPASLGSTLISAGTIDPKQFPHARVVTKGNLVAVVSPDEWEAIQAAEAVAKTTKWTEWSGLPGSDKLTEYLRAQQWGKPSSTKGNADQVTAGLAQAAKTITATYRAAVCQARTDRTVCRDSRRQRRWHGDNLDAFVALPRSTRPDRQHARHAS